MRFKDFVRPSTLEEAWLLNQKRSNRIIGGTLWMRMSKYSFGTAIDLSGLNLDKIEENGDEIVIGCMTSLHAIETNELINSICMNAANDALTPIVGVQFRNCATVGGSIFGRFGFSDVLTLFMALDAEVELYKAGRMPITEFTAKSWCNDILTHIIIKKHTIRIKYLSQRNSKTDFPVLTCAVSEINGNIRACIGARPMRSICIEMPEGMKDAEFPSYVQQNAAFGSNMRASAEFRRHIAGILTRRALEAIRRCEN